MALASVLLFSHQVVYGSFATPWTVACQILLFTGFPRQEYWSGLPFPPSGHIPYPGIKHMSSASLHWQADSFTPGHQGSTLCLFSVSSAIIYARLYLAHTGISIFNSNNLIKFPELFCKFISYKTVNGFLFSKKLSDPYYLFTY